MKLPKPHNTTVILMIVSLIAGVTVYLATGPRQVTITLTPPVSPAPSATLGPPTAINIPKIHKNLPIKPATVRGNEWELFGDAVAWLSTSAVPGEGNVILYAHDWTNLWADLSLVKPGDTIEVQQNNIWKPYKVTQSRAVDQHDTQSVLSDENRLTLYTCEGSFDQKRRLVYAVPVE